MNSSQSMFSNANKTTVINLNTHNGKNGAELGNGSLCTRRTSTCNCNQITNSNSSVISEGRWEWVETEVDYLKSLLNTPQSLLEVNLTKLYQLISGSYKVEEIIDPFGLKYFHLYRENSLLLRLVLFNYLKTCQKERVVKEFINKLAVKLKNCINNWKENHYGYEIKDGKFVIHLTKQDSVELDPKLPGSQAWLCSLFKHFIESEDFLINMSQSVKDIQMLINHAKSAQWGQYLEEKLKEINPEKLQEHLISAYDNLTSFDDVSQKVKSLNAITQILQYYASCGYTINEQLIFPILEAAQNCMSSKEAQVYIATINLLSQLTQSKLLPQSSLKSIIHTSLNILKGLKATLDEKRENWQLEFKDLEGRCTQLRNEKGNLEERCIDLKNSYYNWEMQYIAWEKIISSFKDSVQSVITLFTCLFQKGYLPNDESQLLNISIQLIEYSYFLLPKKCISADILHLYSLLTQHKLFVTNKNTLHQIFNAVSEILSSILAAPFSITKKSLLADGLQERDKAIEKALVFINAFVTAELLNHEDEGFESQIKLINTISIQAASLSGNKVLPYVLDLLLSLYQVGYLNKDSKNSNQHILNQIEFKLSGNYSTEIQLKTLLILDVLISKKIVTVLPKQIVKKLIEQVGSESESLKNKVLNILCNLLSLPKSPYAIDILALVSSEKVSTEMGLKFLSILERLLLEKEIAQKTKNFSAVKDQLILIIKQESLCIEIANKAFSMLKLMDENASSTLLGNIIIKRISITDSYKDIDLFNNTLASCALYLSKSKKQLKNAEIGIFVGYFKKVVEAHEDDRIRMKVLDILPKFLNQYKVLSPNLSIPAFEAIAAISQTISLSIDLKNALINFIKFLLSKEGLQDNLPVTSAQVLLEHYSQTTDLPPQFVISYSLKLLEENPPEILKSKVLIILEKILDLGTQAQIIDLLASTLSAKVTNTLRIKSLDLLEKYITQHMLSVKSKKTKNSQHKVSLFEKNTLIAINSELKMMVKVEGSSEMQSKAIDLFVVMDEADLVKLEYQFVQKLLLNFENRKNLGWVRSINSVLVYFSKKETLPSEKREVQYLLTYLTGVYQSFDDITINNQVLDILNKLLFKFHLVPVEDLELLFNTLLPDARSLEIIELELKEKILSLFGTLVESNFNLNLNGNALFMTYAKKPKFPDSIAYTFLDKCLKVLSTRNLGNELEALVNLKSLTEYLSESVLISEAFSAVLLKVQEIDKRPNLSEGHRVVVNGFLMLLPRVYNQTLAMKVLQTLPSSISLSALKISIQELNETKDPDYSPLEAQINVFAKKISQEDDAMEIKDINGYLTNLCLLLQKKGLTFTLRQCILKLFIELIPKGDGITIGLIRSALLALLKLEVLTEEIPLALELSTQLLAGNHFSKDHKDTVTLIEGWINLLMNSATIPSNDNNFLMVSFISQFIEENHLTGDKLLFTVAFYGALATMIINTDQSVFSEKLLIQSLKSLTTLTKIVTPVDDVRWRRLVTAMNNLLNSGNKIIQTHAIAALSATISKCSIPEIFHESLLENAEKLLDEADLIVQSQALNVCACLVTNKILHVSLYERLKNKALELWKLEGNNPSEGCVRIMQLLAENNHLEDSDIVLLKKIVKK